ncbi:uncharacterized protein J4E79_002985 [Alternaria viburni]|uniref:uncharacterized protein n=1 Tax=Alternaria viburni TaxID=566460 RepID=UPI0020C3E9D3|nr:uncharacterized protein J4E79_002985 [Alternaria viburni]KAI4664687.1 hypothetical protein J4E79_002985 [Alternaria viburni]
MSYRSTDSGTRNWSDSDGGELSDSDDESLSNYENDYDYEEPEDDGRAAGDEYDNNENGKSELEEEGDLEPIETVAPEPESKLATSMKANFRVIKGLMKGSRIKWEEIIEEADESYAAETKSLGERREQIKGHEHILRKRTRVHKRLRRAVTPAHNALRKEDHKECILISEFFDAVKIERTAIEVRRAEKIKKAEEVHVQEYEALVELLRGLQVMARLSGVELDVDEDGDD